MRVIDLRLKSCLEQVPNDKLIEKKTRNSKIVCVYRVEDIFYILHIINPQNKRGGHTF